MSDVASRTIYDATNLYAGLLDSLAGAVPSGRHVCTAATALEDDWQEWLTTLFPAFVRAGFGPHHTEFWAWVWAMRPAVRPHPFVAIWPRGGAKSTSSELACVAVGALHKRRYGLYISETQELADKHVASIGALLESDAIARHYPALGERDVSKYGSSRGWRRNRLRTAAGFTIDSVGLDTAVRGIKIEDARPDFMVIDDVDSVLDSPEATRKKIVTLTQSLLPAGSTDLAVLAVQNLIHPDSIFSRMAGVSQESADFLADRIVSGPFPAIADMTTERQDGRTIITGGTSIWAGQDLQACQDAIDTYGESAFRRESQHEVDDPTDGLFGHIEFRHCTPDAVPDLVKVAVWVDPAVSDTDQSDSHGLQVDGLGPDGLLYRLFSWEQRSSPEASLRKAIEKALQYGALEVGVETDQGGDTWQTVFAKVLADMRAAGDIPAGRRVPTFKSAKAGSGYGPKAQRASQMLVSYEQAKIIHVTGTHTILERALRRFPLKKPYDLTDAAFWCWNDLMGKWQTPTTAPRTMTRTSPWRR